MNVQKAYYEIVRDVLALNIGEGALPQGTRLYVAAVADRLSVSRSPVKRALELLSDEGVVTRDGARGYVVGRTVVDDTSRPNLHLLDLHLPGNETAALVAPSWEMIVQKVDQELLNAIPFGIYQISESGICDHFKVSRTVTREVLARPGNDCQGPGFALDRRAAKRADAGRSARHPPNRRTCGIGPGRPCP